MSNITIRHNRQLGTMIYGTGRMPGIGKALTEWPCGFRGSENLPEDDELGDPYWYLPHSRRRTADTFKIGTARTRLESLGHTVTTDIDNTTPATDFAAFMEEKYDRAAGRAAHQDYLARREMWTSESIRTANEHTYAMLNATPILIGHHSEHRHRRLLDRLWAREGKAWALYDKAKHHAWQAAAAGEFRARKEDPGTTQRRILGIETDLRRIGRALDNSSARMSDYSLAVYRAEIVEKLDEISYWWQVLDDAGVRVWGPDDFTAGDFVSWSVGRWHEVARVNAKSVSVAGRFSDGSPIQTLAGLTRLNVRPQPLPYHEIIAHLTAAQARERFPDVFAELDAAPARPRPKRTRGTVRLSHHHAPEGERWQWCSGGIEYRTYWPHPPGWWRGDREPITSPGVIRVSARHAGQRTAPASHGEAVAPAVAEVPVEGDIAWAEEVHNQLRAHVETYYGATS